MVIVSDGRTAWFYDPSANRVMVGCLDELETPLPKEMLTNLQDLIQEVLDLSDVKLVGEEAVLDRQAYQLTLSQKEDAERQVFPGGGTATLWIDQEQWIPLKATYEASAFGQGEVELRSFELNLGLDNDLFTFEPPADAEVVDLESQQPEPLTLDEAREQAGFQLLVPDDVPAGATLIEVFKLGDSFILRYDHSPNVSFAIVQGSEISELAPLEAQAATLTADIQEVTVRGQAGSAIVEPAEGNTLLSWRENGVPITVVGRISLDEALQVAESLK